MEIKENQISKNHQALMDSYLINLKRLNKSEHTIKNYRSDLTKFFYWMENIEKIKINYVNGETVSRYKEFLARGGTVYQQVYQSPQLAFLLWFKIIISNLTFKKRSSKSLLLFQNPMSVSSRRRHISSLKNFFEYLKESHEDTSNKFSKNPVKSKIHAITLKEVDVISTKIISKEDFLLIEEKTYKTKERLMLYLLYYGGLRLSELRNLKVSDFDFNAHVISFVRKGGSIHTLPIQKSELIFKNLKFFLENNHHKSEYLFQNVDGKPYSLKSIYNQIKKMIERATLDSEITPHSFRKACATDLYIKTKDLLWVRDYLNHSDAKVTQTYIDKATLSQLRRKLH